MPSTERDTYPSTTLFGSTESIEFVSVAGLVLQAPLVRFFENFRIFQTSASVTSK